MRIPKINVINDTHYRAPSWIMRKVRAWGGASVYVAPNGDAMAVPLDGPSLDDRMLVGVYTPDADTRMVKGDLEAALWEIEA